MASARQSLALRALTPLGILAAVYAQHQVSDLEDNVQFQEQVTSAGEVCVESGLGASGKLFSDCVEESVYGGIGGEVDRGYLELVRNFSCSVDDAGTPPIRTLRLTLNEGYDACSIESPEPIEHTATIGDPIPPEFEYLPGMLPGGNDLRSMQGTAAQAAEACLEMPECAGYTMTGGTGMAGVHNVWFKSSCAGFQIAEGWHTLRRKKPSSDTCAAMPAGTSAETKTVHVDIVREEPLVAILRGFFSVEECEALVQGGGDLTEYDRAHTDGGGYSSYRRSYSANIYPPLDDPESNITRLTLRMFEATRELTGYKVFPRGQEPINGVLYQFQGDEYRPHCDGSCAYEEYMKGERVATSITYCRVPELGGATSFTVGALKAQPRMGDMLLFGYWPERGEQMAGNEAEHSGCPLRKGLKWIATQWYREGLHDGFNWEMANAAHQKSR